MKLHSDKRAHKQQNWFCFLVNVQKKKFLPKFVFFFGRPNCKLDPGRERSWNGQRHGLLHSGEWSWIGSECLKGPNMRRYDQTTLY